MPKKWKIWTDYMCHKFCTVFSGNSWKSLRYSICSSAESFVTKTTCLDAAIARGKNRATSTWVTRYTTVSMDDKFRKDRLRWWLWPANLWLGYLWKSQHWESAICGVLYLYLYRESLQYYMVRRKILSRPNLEFIYGWLLLYMFPPCLYQRYCMFTL